MQYWFLNWCSNVNDVVIQSRTSNRPFFPWQQYINFVVSYTNGKEIIQTEARIDTLKTSFYNEYDSLQKFHLLQWTQCWTISVSTSIERILWVVPFTAAVWTKTRKYWKWNSCYHALFPCKNFFNSCYRFQFTELKKKKRKKKTKQCFLRHQVIVAKLLVRFENNSEKLVFNWLN